MSEANIDPLVEQALSRILAAHHQCVKWYHDATQWNEESWEDGVDVNDLWQRELRAALKTLAESATQALREQLEQAQGDRDAEKARADAAVANWLTAEKLGASWVGATEKAEAQLAIVEQERDALKAAIGQCEPWHFVGMYDEQRCFFCDVSRDTAEHPHGAHEDNCIWALANACTPTKSAP